MVFSLRACDVIGLCVSVPTACVLVHTDECIWHVYCNQAIVDLVERGQVSPTILKRLPFETLKHCSSTMAKVHFLERLYGTE